MALVNLTTIYTTQNWTLNNAEDTTIHTDYTPENVPAQKKFNLFPSLDQTKFYQTNAKNIGLDQVQSVSEKGNHNGIGNLQTSLTSLPFGMDTKGGGSSDQPFITFDMNGDAHYNPKNTNQVRPAGTSPAGFIKPGDILSGGKSLVDFPKRGGDYPSNDIDFRRISAFLNTENGEKFLKKQKALQFMNPRIETGTSMKVSNNTQMLPGLIENTRVYSPDNLLNQIKVQGTGGHISRIGASNLAIQDNFYANTVGLQNLTNSSALNRLVILQKLKIAKSNSNAFSSFDQLLGATESILVAKSLGISTNQTQLFNYPGGPNSGDGLGNTTIGRYVDTTLAATLNTLPGVMGYAQIAQQNAIKDGPITPDSIQDFRSKIAVYRNSKSNWKYSNIQETFHKNNPGVTNKNSPQGKPTDYTAIVPGYVDLKSIDSLYPTVFKNDSDPWKKLGYTDSIKLGFECMSNDYTQYSTALIFRALLTNGFTDNNAASLNSFRYMGRGEEFFTYQGFTRQIGFSFKIAAFSRTELKPMYNKLNYLISQVYPDYSPNTNVMRAPLIKLTLGDYLYRVPGFIESINVTADNSTPWEINLEEKTGLDNSSTVQELPHVLEIQISFKPIHSILPQRASFTIDKSEGLVNLDNNTSTINTIGQIQSQQLIGNYMNSFISSKLVNQISSDQVSSVNIPGNSTFNPNSMFSQPAPTAPPIQQNNFGSGPSSDKYDSPEYYLENPTQNNTILV